MKKLISILVITVMACSFFVFAGCGETEVNESGDTSTYVELEWWTGYPLGITPTDLDKVLAVFNNKLKSKLNCTIDFHFVDWLSYTSTMALKINALDEFDICFTGSMFNDYFSNVSKEAFYDITDLLPVYASDIEKTVDEKYRDVIKVNGRTYGVINRQIASRQYAAVFKKETFLDYTENAASYGNKTEAKSLEEITKLSDVTDFLAFVSDKYDSNYITSTFDMDGIFYFWGMDTFGNWKLPGVVRYDDDSYRVINQFDTDEWREAMTLGRSWYNNSYYWPNMSTQTPNYSKFSMRFAPTYKPGMETEEFMVSNYDTVTAKLGPSVIYTSGMLSAMNAISSTSKNPTRALQVLNLLYTDKELYNILIYGLEGEHYEVVKELDNGLKVINRINTDKYSMPLAWAFGDNFNMYLENGQDEDVWEQTIAVDEAAETSVTFGFVFDPTPVKTQVANCQAVVNNYWYALMVGLGKDNDWLNDTYSGFLTQLEKAGANTIIAEKQRQLDAWLESRS
ncbi:MAG: ABC transporter substrate-binding protein [Christensenellales bacterium]